nr:PREDICTED: 28S ribosomal protein S15, mitochondrial [Lepisosteus oculatus]
MLLSRAIKSASCLREWSFISSITQNISLLTSPHGARFAVSARPLSHCFHSRWTAAQQESRNSSSVVQAVRNYVRAVRKRQEVPSQLDDLPATMLKIDYAAVQMAEKADDTVKKLLTLELASHKEKLRIKKEQLMAKVKRNESDRGSTEVQVAVLTAKIRNYQEHLQYHTKDKANKRRMLMAIDRRKKLLKYLRRTRYDLFENVCQQLGITYTFPPEYYRRVTRRWAAKKAFCIKVFNEVQKQKAAEKKRQREAATLKEESADKQKGVDGSPV